jgi:hypothetical protein
MLLEFIVGGEPIAARTFQLIYEHFGPDDGILDRLHNFCLSLFLRGWSIGAGDRSSELLPGARFCFRLGSTSAELRNNFHEMGQWYHEADGRKTDLEGFLERTFPMEIPSEAHLVRFIENNFPEDLFHEEGTCELETEADSEP